ncbi:hypothetical protein ACHQM5_001611 [Ranunculus cassubicifolius]
MSNMFKAAIRIDDLNDYSTTSQGCVKSSNNPLIKQKPRKFATSINPDPATVAMDYQKKKVTIALEDCLACSGCVTSVQTVMSGNQSLDELLSNLNIGKEVIISFSPQSRASLAAHFSLSPLQKESSQLCSSHLGVKAVYDTSCSRDLSLIESCNEFVARYKHNGFADRGSPFPMIASSCPSWIHDAEKLKGFNILPYISSVKSPQQTIGAIIKHYICPKLSIELDKVFHVAIMPCHEKKNEAARADFQFSADTRGENASEVVNQRFSEVDLVMTTEEVLNLIQLKSVDFKALEESSLDELLTNADAEGYLYGVNGSSGGYAETIFCHAAKTIFGRQMEGPLISKPNEIQIFKNAGCLNGSGQIKSKSSDRQSANTLLQSVQQNYMKDRNRHHRLISFSHRVKLPDELSDNLHSKFLPSLPDIHRLVYPIKLPDNTYRINLPDNHAR